MKGLLSLMTLHLMLRDWQYVLLLLCFVSATWAQSPTSSPVTPHRLTFLFHADPVFFEGLRHHGLLENHGFRLHNTGLDTRPFGTRWKANPLIEQAEKSNRLYYIDRITGGMPYQNLDGIESVAERLKDDPNFLGFQVHEWGNSPIHDYQRIQKLLISQGLPFDRARFAGYEGRVEYPFFSGGDYDTYRKLFGPLNSLADVNRYLERYFRQIVARTDGQVMAVNGYVQLYHTALRLGAKNVMAEIGNQVPLTGLQIACVRGAARQYGKPFGVYYEPWGGKPFGCPCAIGWSPWFPDKKSPDKRLMGGKIRPELGSSRSLQRRLLYFAWLSGASYLAEEWGAENYFTDWQSYQLTEYGQIMRSFLETISAIPALEPVVPAAIVMPPGTQGIDLKYLSGERDKLYGLVPPDEFHLRLRRFAKDILGARPKRLGADDFNLTPSPQIGCFDVVSPNVSEAELCRYDIVVYFDEAQAHASRAPEDRIYLYPSRQDDEELVVALRALLPYSVEGEVGCSLAQTRDRYLLGVFNNLGVTKTAEAEVADPSATREAVIRGSVSGAELLVGTEYVTRRAHDAMTLQIPAGALAVVSFPKQ
jgi:hypothetical protein